MKLTDILDEAVVRTAHTIGTVYIKAVEFVVRAVALIIIVALTYGAIRALWWLGKAILH